VRLRTRGKIQSCRIAKAHVRTKSGFPALVTQACSFAPLPAHLTRTALSESMLPVLAGSGRLTGISGAPSSQPCLPHWMTSGLVSRPRIVTNFSCTSLSMLCYSTLCPALFFISAVQFNQATTKQCSGGTESCPLLKFLAPNFRPPGTLFVLSLRSSQFITPWKE